ncbi:glycosyltransferase [Arthrobacter sp. SO5]|uniref:glycosyltransferase n=1 Tax=Arthrobacter sp. SO5 TaxID=1897055 RepID=UPI001E4C8A9E|nr:glycosyltransferase [Arthrobacter sp. SO5]
MTEAPITPRQFGSVAAVVSVFNPAAAAVENVRWLLRYVPHVVVVNDGSSADVTAVLSQMKALGAVVISLGVNSGIAAALNTGIQAARTRWSPEWVVTMDQDSRFSGDYIGQALDAEKMSRNPETIAMVCAQLHNGMPLPVLNADTEAEVFDPMQSGTLIRATVFDRVGYLDEALFIDCVDSEFNARVRNAGLRAIAGPGCNLEHSLGDARPLRVLGWHARLGQKRLFVHYHAPFRVYYITRNSLVMARKYFRQQPLWVIRRMGMELQSHVVRLVYGPNRRKHALATLSGIRDAMRGRLGKIDEQLAARLR